MKTFFLAGVASVLALAMACSSSSSNKPGTSSSSSKKIDSNGGTVSAGQASVAVPAGALPSATEITVAQSAVDVSPPDGYVMAGPPIAFTPHGLSFSAPVTLTLPYTPPSADEQLAILRLDNEDDTSWEVVEGGAFADGSAAVEVSGFSIYAVAAAQSSAGTGGSSGVGGVGGTNGGTSASGTGGADEAAGAAATSGAGNTAGDAGAGAVGDVSYSCDGTDPQSGLRICSDLFFPALIVQLAGGVSTVGCQAPSVLIDGMCDPTGSLGGCFYTDVDGLPGVTATHWYFYTGTPPDLTCADGGTPISPP